MLGRGCQNGRAESDKLKLIEVVSSLVEPNNSRSGSTSCSAIEQEDTGSALRRLYPSFSGQSSIARRK